MSLQDTPLSRPLPPLPLELKHHILRFCDPSTLANTSRVSLAFLHLSSPILYQDIEIVGLKNVEKLFCSRDPSLDHPHLHPHLSLFLIRNITIVATPDVGGEALNLSISRLPPPSSLSLPVDLLTLRPIGINSHLDDEEDLHRWSSLLSFFNPVAAHVFGLQNESFNFGNTPRFHLAPYPSKTRWPRLSHLHCTNVIHVGLVSRSVTSDSPFVLLFDLSSNWGEKEYMADLIGDALYEMGTEAASPQVKEFVVRVSLGQRMRRKAFMEELVECWWQLGATEIENALKRIRFEDATATCCWNPDPLPSSST
ncbi:hypothetical protein BDY24DRAFT_377137 [Mrakia frigida]|uniref:uncharacterized protein n=1 Tax=Mrakia frigida TaxID=29902 RepID=UPI003FCC2525